MKKFGLFLAFILTVSIPAFSQLKHDNIWTMGYGQIWPSSDGYPFGGVIMDFSTAPPTLTLRDYLFDTPRAAISDKNGRLVAYTNGCRIFNRNHEGMFNGDTLSPGNVYEEFCTEGSYSAYPDWQPCVFLPKPDSDSLYYLFHLRDDDYLWNPMNLMYSVVDASGKSGNGVVISKNNSVLSDSVFLGQYVSATRHGNGRDWWIITPRRWSNGIHVSLLGREGVEYKGMQNVYTKIDSAYWGSQATFSTDGSKYFRNSQDGFLMLDFDRCTGLLSNPVYLNWDSLPYGGRGVATSPNSRFLYLTSGGTVQQYDLWAPDLATSMQIVAVYDGFQAPYPTTLYLMMPGPDGKIYIITTADNNVLHVIHNPNEQGLACNVEQHALTLPARQSYIITNFANYNLGPIDGSTCDTLGIDNLPVARFQWNVEDTLSPQQIAFTDYSYHVPTTWHWDFGDGTTSQDINPVHLYTAPGTYTVCLTVCNANACDTLCQVLEIEAVSTVTLQGEKGDNVLLWPNPAGDLLHLKSASSLEAITLFDVRGQEVMRLSASNEQELALDLRHIPAGLYLISVQAVGKTWGGKFVKI